MKLTHPSIERYDKRGVSAFCRSFEINSREEPLRRCLPLPRLSRSLQQTYEGDLTDIARVKLA